MFKRLCRNSITSATKTISANRHWSDRVGAFLFSGLILFATGSSFAAGLPEPDAPLPDPGYSRTSGYGQGWSNFYMGAALGYGFGNTAIIGDSGDVNVDTDGAYIGLYLGRDWQFNNFVVGLEGEWGGGDMSGNASGGAMSYSADLNWMAAIRARAGVLLNPSLLIYATGGYAWADMDIRASGANSFNISDNLSGYQVGGGAEFRFSPQWSLRFDYIYTDLEDVTISSGGVTNNFDPDFHLIRTGLTMRF